MWRTPFPGAAPWRLKSVAGGGKAGQGHQGCPIKSNSLLKRGEACLTPKIGGLNATIRINAGILVPMASVVSETLNGCPRRAGNLVRAPFCRSGFSGGGSTNDLGPYWAALHRFTGWSRFDAKEWCAPDSISNERFEPKQQGAAQKVNTPLARRCWPKHNGQTARDCRDGPPVSMALHGQPCRRAGLEVPV